MLTDVLIMSTYVNEDSILTDVNVLFTDVNVLLSDVNALLTSFCVHHADI